MKAKIVLQFNDVKGSLVNAHRNLVGTQKVGIYSTSDATADLRLLFDIQKLTCRSSNVHTALVDGGVCVFISELLNSSKVSL